MATNYNYEPVQPRQERFCRNCGGGVTSAFCTHCGAATNPAFEASMRFVDSPRITQSRAPGRTRGIRRSDVLILLVAGAVALVGTTVMLGRGPVAAPAAAVAAAATPSPSPTASPSPSPTPTPKPTPTLRPTPVPDPTNTPDDVKLTAIIKDGVAGIIDRLSTGSSATSLVALTRAFRDLSSFADSELARLSIYTPSTCTSEAVRLYRSGLIQMQTVADDFVSWVAAGGYGPSPDVSGARRAGETLGSALQALQASPC